MDIYGDFYDYNGVLFCHGQFTGLEECSYVIMTVGGRYRYKAFIKDNANFPGIFNVNTYSHAINSSPQFLNSGTYTVYLAFYTASNAVVDEGYLYDGASRLDYRMHNTLYAPTLSYDSGNKTITVTNQGTGRYYLEIRRQNRNKVKTEYTETEKDYLFTTLMKGTEGGKFYEGVPHTSFVGQGDTDIDGNLYEPIPKARYQWRSDIPTVVLFDSEANFTLAQKEQYYSLACEALDDLEGITGKTFSGREQETRAGDTDFYTCMTNDYRSYYWDNDNAYLMIIRYGTDATMCLGGQGLWRNYLAIDPSRGVVTSHPSIAVDLSQENETIKHVTYEEIMQSLGMGNDSHSQETSLHWDPHWSNPESYTGIDKKILELVCSDIVCGWSGFDFLNQWDTPCILFQDYTGQNLVFDVSELNENEEYYAWAWIAREGAGGGIVGGSCRSDTTGVSGCSVADGWDDDPYSMRTQISFNTKPSYPHPGQFSWTYPKRKGEGFIVAASEWNALQEHIEKMLLHKLGAAHNWGSTDVSKGEIVTASKYNNAANGIKKITGYGTYIPTVAPGNEITADTNTDDITANNINMIVNELNAIP